MTTSARLQKPAAWPQCSFRIAAGLVLIALVLRGLYVLHMGFNSDEPQHAHVLWMARLGFVQYRDFADNHAPLFYLLWLPFVRLLPATWAAMIDLRLSMLPIYLAAVACTYAIAQPLFGRRMAVWPAALLALWPTYYEQTLEFRPDQLWALFWLAAVSLAVRRRFTAKRAWCVGVCLGCATAVSLKTLPLLVCLLVAAAATRRIFRRRGSISVAAMFAFVAGLLAAPAIVCFHYWRLDALGDLYAGVIGFNVSSGASLHADNHLKLVVALVLLVVVALIARWISRHARPTVVNRRRVFVGLLAMLTMVLFRLVWPAYTSQDGLPITPLVVIAWFALGVSLRKQLPQIQSRLLTPRAGVLATAALLAALFWRAPYHNDTSPFRASIEQASTLVKPGEPVIDLKGEFVFYPRAVRSVYETLARHSLKNDPSLDMGPEQIVASGARVSPRSVPNFPARTQQFIVNNFVPLSAVAVAGKRLDISPDGRTFSFHLALADSYDVMAHDRLVSKSVGDPAKLPADRFVDGLLDGRPVSWPCYIGAGDHVFSPGGPVASRLTLVWHRAVEQHCAIAWDREVRP